MLPIVLGLIILGLILLVWDRNRRLEKARTDLRQIESELSIAKNKNKEYLLAFQQIEFAGSVGFNAAGVHLSKEPVHR